MLASCGVSSCFFFSFFYVGLPRKNINIIFFSTTRCGKHNYTYFFIFSSTRLVYTIFFFPFSLPSRHLISISLCPHRNSCFVLWLLSPRATTSMIRPSGPEPSWLSRFPFILLVETSFINRPSGLQTRTNLSRRLLLGCMRYNIWSVAVCHGFS